MIPEEYLKESHAKANEQKISLEYTTRGIPLDLFEHHYTAALNSMWLSKSGPVFFMDFAD